MMRRKKAQFEKRKEILAMLKKLLGSEEIIQKL